MLVSAAKAGAVLANLRLAIAHSDNAAALVGGDAGKHLEAQGTLLMDVLRDVTRIRDALLVSGPVGTSEPEPVVLPDPFTIPRFPRLVASQAAS